MARHYCPNCYSTWECTTPFPCEIEHTIECSLECLESMIRALEAKRQLLESHKVDKWPPVRVGEDGD